MKKVIISTILLLQLFSVDAQKSDSTVHANNKFDKEKLSIGGDLTAQFYNGVTVLGINPYLSYSLYKWLDVAFDMNVSYYSQRDYPDAGDKIRQIIYAPGVFTRIYPVHFLFLHAQYEHNFVTQKYIPNPTYGFAEEKYKYDVNSLLLGLGYSSDRDPDDNTFYYISIMFDVLHLPGSPYTNSYGDVTPIYKAGFNFKLFNNSSRNSISRRRYRD